MEGEGQFSSCRFDFRIDSKNGLTPSRRKKVEKRHVNYNTLFKCKVCSKLLESRAALLAHKVVHNFFKCDFCDEGFQKKVLWRIHVRNKHGRHMEEPGLVADVKTTEEHMEVENDREVEAGEVRQEEMLSGLPELIPASRPVHMNPSPMPSAGMPGMSAPLLPGYQAVLPANSMPAYLGSSQTCSQTESSSSNAICQSVTGMSPALSQSVMGMSPAICQSVTGMSPALCQSVTGMSPALCQSVTGMSPALCQSVTGMSPALSQSVNGPLPTSDLSVSDSSQAPVTPMMATQSVTSPNFPGFVCINVPIYIANGSPSPSLQPLVPGLPPPHFTSQPLPISQSPAVTFQSSQMTPAHIIPASSVPAIAPRMFSPALPMECSSTTTTSPPSLIRPPGAQTADLEPGEIRNLQKGKVPATEKKTYSTFPGVSKPNPALCPNEMALDFSVQSNNKGKNCPILESKSESENNDIIAIDLSCKHHQKEGTAKTEGGAYSVDKSLACSDYSNDKQLMQDEYKDLGDQSEVLPKQDAVILTKREVSMKKTSRVGGRAGGLSKMVEKLWKTKMTEPAKDKSGGACQQNSGSTMAAFTDRSLSRCVTKSPVLILPDNVTMETQKSVELELVKNERTLGRSALFGEIIASQNVQVEEQPSQVIEVPTSSTSVPVNEEFKNLTNVSNWRFNKEQEQVSDYSTFKFHVCPVCKQLFANSILMRQHMRKDHSTKKNVKKAASNKTVLAAKAAKNAQKRMQCPRCKFSTSSLFALKYHRITVHPEMYGSTALLPDETEGCNETTKTAEIRDVPITTAPKPSGRTLTCRYPGCGRVFREHRHLRVHQTFHTAEKPMTCSFCPYTCQYEGSMSWHLRSKHPNNSSLPVRLNKKTRRMSYESRPGKGHGVIEAAPEEPEVEAESSNEGLVVDLTTSSRANTPSMPNDATDKPDPDQNESRSTDKLLSLYKVEASPGPDPKFFTSVMRFRSYRKTGSSSESNRLACSCGVCGMTCEDPEAMWNHKLVQHHGDYVIVCDSSHCDYQTKDKSQLQSHMMSTHGKELGEFKDFICFLCGKGYASKNGLNHHMMRHSEAGPPVFECQEKGCHSRLISKAALRSHVRRIHQRNNNNSNSSMVDKIQVTDNNSSDASGAGDDRLLVCNFPGCKRSFRESKHLKVHRMQHTNEKPLKCDLCFYSCRQRNSMNWHMKSKHGMDKHVTPDGRTIYLGNNDNVPKYMQ